MKADAVLLLSFGGPEAPYDVMPFLRRVVAGRGVPDARLQVVERHYQAFGGRSPINDENRALRSALQDELARRDRPLRVYWGNRFWHPLLADTARTMRDDGVQNALVFATSAFGSFSGCRAYQRDLDGVDGPAFHKLRPFSGQPGFLEAVTAEAAEARRALGPNPRLIFTAHSIPRGMAATSPYVEQLQTACAEVASRLGMTEWRLAWQSRSGPPQVPWLEPDICDVLRELPEDSEVLLVPIGFVSDHMEVDWDLDTEAAAAAAGSGVTLARAQTPGRHPAFVGMAADLIEAALDGGEVAAPCASDCCPAPRR